RHGIGPIMCCRRMAPDTFPGFPGRLSKPRSRAMRKLSRRPFGCGRTPCRRPLLERPMSSLLFSPLELRGVTLRNRIVLAPMLTYQARNGFVNDWHVIHYGKYAIGGAGLVFVESTKVDPRGCTTPNDLGLWKD